METLTAVRVLAGQPRGSSRPVLMETARETRLVKLHGAAQGPGALVAELIVAALAESLGLRVPARSLVVVDPGVPTADRDDELAALLDASVGLNLGFEVLDGARDVETRDIEALEPLEKGAVLWLDRLVLNPDRTSRNPNLLWWRDQLWLIDNGAALRFQYDWPGVTEAAPRDPRSMRDPHLFEAVAGSAEWAEWDLAFARRLGRSVIEGAVEAVPADFLVPLLPRTAGALLAALPDALRRRRAAYAAFLWKRLQPPRAFAHATPGYLSGNPRGKPDWLKPRR